MKLISWSAEKNALLKAERGVSFDTVEHPHQERYPGQQIHVIAIKEYVYLVPFVESEEEVFLKTIIPSRKATKSYLGEES